MKDVFFFISSHFVTKSKGKMRKTNRQNIDLFSLLNDANQIKWDKKTRIRIDGFWLNYFWILLFFTSISWKNVAKTLIAFDSISDSKLFQLLLISEKHIWGRFAFNLIYVYHEMLQVVHFHDQEQIRSKVSHFNQFSLFFFNFSIIITCQLSEIKSPNVWNCFARNEVEI